MIETPITDVWTKHLAFN